MEPIFETTKASVSDNLASTTKVKSTNRMRYEAEVSYLKRQNGGLEQIRQKLGLSRRKICQLLLVDPSAWSRWTSEPSSEAPPHIYRALDWYLAILEKDPEYRRMANRFASWLNQEKEFDARLKSLESKLFRGKWKKPWLVAAVVFFLGTALGYLLFAHKGL